MVSNKRGMGKIARLVCAVLYNGLYQNDSSLVIMCMFWAPYDKSSESYISSGA